LRIAEQFESVALPDHLQDVLSSAPLRMYERNCWNGALELGEMRAPILRSHATDIFAGCLAFTVPHLVLLVAQSTLPEYAMVLDPTRDRKALRLAAEFAHRLTEALCKDVRAERSESANDPRDENTEKTIQTFAVISQIMYPAISEVRASLANYRHRDPAMRWLRAINHALFLTTHPVDEHERAILGALAKLFDETVASFYPYFLATAFGNSVYAQFDA